MLIERALLLSLVIFLLLLLAFLSRYPITLSRNVLSHSIIYTVFFLSSSVSFLARSLLGWEVARPVNTLFMAISCACVLAWAGFLRARGEVETRSGIHWGAAEEQRLINQLNSLNATLLRAVRK
jgi:hypothetical protein